MAVFPVPCRMSRADCGISASYKKFDIFGLKDALQLVHIDAFGGSLDADRGDAVNFKVFNQ